MPDQKVPLSFLQGKCRQTQGRRKFTFRYNDKIAERIDKLYEDWMSAIVIGECLKKVAK